MGVVQPFCFLKPTLHHSQLFCHFPWRLAGRATGFLTPCLLVGLRQWGTWASDWKVGGEGGGGTDSLTSLQGPRAGCIACLRVTAPVRWPEPLCTSSGNCSLLLLPQALGQRSSCLAAATTSGVLWNLWSPYALLTPSSTGLTVLNTSTASCLLFQP